MQILSIVTIGLFIIANYLDRKEIKSIRQMSLSKDKYISLLEKRLRQERVAKNRTHENNTNS